MCVVAARPIVLVRTTLVNVADEAMLLADVGVGVKEGVLGASVSVPVPDCLRMELCMIGIETLLIGKGREAASLSSEELEPERGGVMVTQMDKVGRMVTLSTKLSLAMKSLQSGE